MDRWKCAKGDIVPGTMKLELHCDPNDFEHLPNCIVIMHDLLGKIETDIVTKGHVDRKGGQDAVVSKSFPL